MIIDCISDTHGCKPALHGGDLLIVAGDLTSSDRHRQYLDFFHWIANQNYKKKIVIAGNHDGLAEKDDILTIANADFDYLEDSGTQYEGLKIWGSPWTARFEGMNPHCMAFTVDTDDELAEKWALIPDDIDILITHSPPFGNLDVTTSGESVGSFSLWKRYREIHPKVFVYGHIHEAYGAGKRLNNETIFINASIMDERYNPVNQPIRVIYEPADRTFSLCTKAYPVS